MSRHFFDIKLTGMDGIEKAFKEYRGKIFPKDMKKVISILAKALYVSVKKNTPVDTGTLRRSWIISKIQLNDAGEYSIVLQNNMEYALYVEYGHRTKGNRWVGGQFFALKSLNNLKDMSKKDMEKLILKSLKKELKKRRRKS